MSELNGKTVLVVGGSSGIGAAIATAVRDAGGTAVAAGRHPGADGVRIDLGDESTIAAAAEQLGEVDHVVSLAADHANGPVGELAADAIRGAFDAKVVGPILLAKHFASRVRPGGSFVFFSGVAAWKPAPGIAVMATTNGAVAFLAEALAVELAPIRVNAVSPGIIDSGAWDGPGKDDFFAETAKTNPVGRVGTVGDVAEATLNLLTSGFVTGTVAHVDGGGRLV